MSVFYRFVFILLYAGFIYVWNRYAIPPFVGKVVRLNPKNNWLARNESNIVQAYQGFFWLAFLLFLASMIWSE